MANQNQHLHTPVTPLAISPGSSISDLVAGMGGTSFQARNLGRGAAIWAQMLSQEVTILFGLAGAMVPAGMRCLLVYLIENRLIDCLVSTGANLFHDLHETLGRLHWQGYPQADDAELARSKVCRIYDVLASEEEFDQAEDFIAEFCASLPQGRAYTSREYLYLLGKELCSLGKEEGILTAAARAHLPIYCPALGDSFFGAGAAAARVKKGSKLLFDIVEDVVEISYIVAQAKSTGVVFIGGGTPKNFIQQAMLCSYLFGGKLPGHEYAIQITTDSPQWGGLSGCALEEALSWKKIARHAQTVTINCDATIALPILVSALAEASAQSIKSRKRPFFRFDKELSVL